MTLKGGELNAVAVRLEQAVPVSGKVVDTAGNPIPGAEIAVGGSDENPLTANLLARSDENG